jgi:hypothetical protein
MECSALTSKGKLLELSFKIGSLIHFTHSHCCIHPWQAWLPLSTPVMCWC